MELSDNLEKHFKIDQNQKKALQKLGLLTIRDLLYYFPSRYTDISEIRYINTLTNGEMVTIFGQISKLEIKKGFKSKIPMSKAILRDETGQINIIWFHQPYLAKMLNEGNNVKVTGKVSFSEKYGLTLTNPEVSKEDILPIDLHDSLFFKNQEGQNKLIFGFPVYAESRGITSKWIYHAILKIIKNECIKNIVEYIPEDILKKYSLPRLRTALIWIHTPQKKEHAEMARKRFAFEEVFFIQLARQKERKEYESLFSYKLKVNNSDIQDFMSRFPFNPTKSQKSVIKTILNDLIKDKPMSRLIEGDVGSGKTFVAATITYAVIKNPAHTSPKGDFGNIQVAYMAPTEVLAIQLFENFVSYFKHTGIQIGLITGSGCRKFPSKCASIALPKIKKNESLHCEALAKQWTEISRNQLLKWVKNGEIPILIGTHALISKSVDFEDLGLVIIDEQHRFGTNQRMKLAKKEGHSPHFLSMTATPIPRTLALTIYGDLDLSVIDEMPQGRKRVITEIISENKREDSYQKIEKELQAGRQLYVICPKIDDPDLGQQIKLDVKSVISEAKRLKEKVFPKYRIEIMHSKMSKQKKEKIMLDFSNHQIDILVSTSVIEVGVNIPNATVIIIEGAERFGLAQLHQLRGRVIRSNYQSYCYLFAEARTDKTMDRLRALTKASNGFELAELDLSLRGAGLLSGDKQWGITDVGMEAIKNIKMVEAARTEALLIVNQDSNLVSYPLLLETLNNKMINLHFE